MVVQKFGVFVLDRQLLNVGVCLSVAISRGMSSGIVGRWDYSSSRDFGANTAYSS